MDMKETKQTNAPRLRRLGAALAAVMAAAMLCASVPMPALQADTVSSSDVKNLEYQIQQNLAHQQEVANKLYVAKTELASETKTKQYIDTKLNLIEQNINDTETLINLYAGQIDEKTTEIEVKSEEIARQYDEIKNYLRLSYQNQNMNYVEMVLASGSLADLFTNIERIGNMIDYQNSMMERLNDNLGELNDMKVVLEEQKTKSEEQMASLEKQKSEFETMAAESEAYMLQLKKDQTTYTRLQNEYKAAEAALNSELEEMLAELARQQAEAYVGGELMWPVPLANKRISSYYGWRDLDGDGKKEDWHLGIDIPGVTGTDIYAANGGTVITAKWHYSYGNYVIVDHGGGRTTLYAHASKLLVNVGDTVKQGEVIAKVGNTGNSFGAHLHFEVRQDGKTQNPLDYVVQPK